MDNSYLEIILDLFDENQNEVKYEIDVKMIKTIYTKEEAILFFKELKEIEKEFLPHLGISIEHESFIVQ